MAVIFLCMVFFAWYLYLRREKMYALLIFFFFITLGFQVIPEDAMKLMSGFSKSTDYALVLIMGCIGFDFLFSKGRYFKKDTFTIYLLLFFVFLLVCILYSRFIIGCGWNEALRASRQYLLLLAFFVFRNTKKEDLEKLLHVLFAITVFQSILFIIQAYSGVCLMGELESSVVKLGETKLYRFYNQPMLLYFMTFLAAYKYPAKGLYRIVAMVIFILAILLGFNRSSIGLTFLMLALGYVMRLPKVKQLRIYIVSAAFFIPTIAIIGHNFMKSRTFIDIKMVISGNFVDTEFDLTALHNSTFAFRMAHLFERILYIEENPEAKLLGAGLIPEDSPMIGRFNFLIGLTNEKENAVYQIETPDITYSVLIMRFGYLGTALFMMIYFYMIYFFFKKRNNDYAFASFLFVIFSIGVSFFSANLIMPIVFTICIFSLNLVNKEEGEIV